MTEVTTTAERVQAGDVIVSYVSEWGRVVACTDPTTDEHRGKCDWRIAATAPTLGPRTRWYFGEGGGYLDLLDENTVTVLRPRRP